MSRRKRRRDEDHRDDGRYQRHKSRRDNRSHSHSSSSERRSRSRSHGWHRSHSRSRSHSRPAAPPLGPPPSLAHRVPPSVLPPSLSSNGIRPGDKQLKQPAEQYDAGAQEVSFGIGTMPKGRRKGRKKAAITFGAAPIPDDGARGGASDASSKSRFKDAFPGFSMPHLASSSSTPSLPPPMSSTQRAETGETDTLDSFLTALGASGEAADQVTMGRLGTSSITMAAMAPYILISPFSL